MSVATDGGGVSKEAASREIYSGPRLIMPARPFPLPVNGDLYRRLVDSLPSYAVILLDCDGRVQHANPAAETIYGYDSVALQGRPFATLLSPAAAGPERADDMLSCAATNGSLRNEGRHRRRDGTDFDADVLVSAVRADDQRLLGYAALIRDLTNRQSGESSDRDRVLALERRVAELTQELAARGRELESFTYSVAHDLRAPLRGVSGYLDALRDDFGDALAAQGRVYLERSIKCASRMHALIDDLVKLSRVGRHEMNLTPVPLGDLVEEVRLQLRAAHPDQGIDWQVGPLPTVVGDGDLLRTALMNLGGNAVKFSAREARSRIEVRHEMLEKEHVLVIRDNGVGFDLRRATELFTPFFRMHPPEEFEGNGVGLAVAARIVRRHGGRIWAESQPGQGATFFFTLPRG